MRGISRGFNPRPPYIAGNWYPTGHGAVQGGAAPGVDTVRAYPFWVERTVTISDLAAKVTTLHAANNFQLAIYANNPATGRPTGSPLAVTGNISTASAVVVSGDIIGVNITLAPGLYWAMINNSGATAVFQALHLIFNGPLNLIGTPTLASVSGAANVGGISLSTPLTFGTWGDLSAAVWTEFFTAATAAMWFKAA